MRIGTKIFILINLISVGFLLNLFSTLISLLFEDAHEDAINAADIMLPDAQLNIPEANMVVPKIIHQTYKNATIPEQWLETQKSCIDLHPDYQYILWTDDKSHDFIEKNYDWFLPIYDSYPYPIQRADAIRYFVLHHYGGIYLDLDDGCARRLDVMRQYPAWLRRTIPTGISNDAMGAIPGHPFFENVIHKLESYARDYGMPYITVMSSTGPLFLSILWKQYKRLATPEDKVHVLMPEEYRGSEWSLFTISKGSSWHGKDAQTIFWMGRHWLLLTISGFAVAGVVFAVMFTCWTKALNKKGHKRGISGGVYEMLPRRSDSESGGVEIDEERRIQ